MKNIIFLFTLCACFLVYGENLSPKLSPLHNVAKDGSNGFIIDSSLVIVKWDFNDLKYPNGIIMIDGDRNQPDRRDPIMSQIFDFKVGDGWKICKGVTDEMKAAFSISYYDPKGQSDDWMIMPEIELPNSTTGLILKWKAVAPDQDHADGYEVYVQEGNPTKISDFTSKPVFSTNNGPALFKEFSADISHLAGKKVRIAFRNNSDSKFMLGIDDISVEYNQEPDDDTSSYKESFNNVLDGYLPDGWLTIDSDGDTYNWFVLNAAEDGMLGVDKKGGYLASQSRDDPADLPLSPDNWLISPIINLDNNEKHILSYYLASQELSLSKETYSIYITTDVEHPRDISLFKEIANETIDDIIPPEVNRLQPGASDWYLRKIDLSNYKGQSIRIALRHHNSRNQFMITIDDIRITNAKRGRDFEDDYHTQEVIPNGKWMQSVPDNVEVLPLGMSEIGTTYCAIRFLPNDLTHVDGQALVAIKFIPTNEHARYTVMAWQVKKGEKPQLETPDIAVLVPDRLIKPKSWVKKLLDNKGIIIDANKELWIGYKVDNINTYNPCGIIPQEEFEEGDWYHFDKKKGWQHLTEINNNLKIKKYKFCIGGLLTKDGEYTYTEQVNNDNFYVYKEDHKLRLRGVVSGSVDVYNISGVLIYSSNNKSELPAPTAPGIYFIKNNNRVRKIII